MKKISLDKIIFLIILIIMIGLPLGKLISYGLFLNGIIEDSFDFNHVWILWISNILLLGTYLYSIFKRKDEIEIEDIIIYGLVILGLVTTYIAQDRLISIFGAENRNEGLLTLLSYFLIFLNVKKIKNEKYFKYMINVLEVLAVIQVIYGILQVYTDLEFIKHYSKPYMAMGLCANPNFYGSYMCLIGLYSASRYLLDRRKKDLILAISFFAGVCLAESTGPFLGYVMGLIFLIIWKHKKMNYQNIIWLALSCFIIFNANDHINVKLFRDNHINYGYNNYNIKEDLVSLTAPIKNVDTIGSGRIGIWKCMLPVAKEYFLLGAGIDNIGIICPTNCGMLYDKAHNVYLQMLITNGFLFLIFYCILCLKLFIQGLKLKENFSIAIYIGFIGYCIQAFANISVIDVAPYFYIFLGILCFSNKKTLMK